ncbi:PepSY domain-containing protein [Shimia ponticola]|uniref:PepSY domain-containing protein n=1 Tax=Shimia ponticola TaxID=2582893 RepID=UPI0011BE715D|nr:PepSY domain-containing protein [Shimia ponticola]
MDTSTLKIGALVGLIAAGSLAMTVSAQSTDTDAVIVTEEAAIAAALEAVPGEVQEVELEREDGAQVYEIEILAEDGTETEVEIAAATGDVLEIEREGGKCDKDRDA